MSFKLLKRLCAFVPVVGALATSTAYASDAASYPQQPIKIVVPFSAGGAVDVLARLLGTSLTKTLGQPIIVENRPGAGSNIGANYVAMAKPDGYTVLLATSAALAVNPSLYKNLAFDPKKDFKPVVLATTLPNLVVVNQKNSVATMQELTQSLKKRGEAAFYASAGSGTPTHLGVELYKQEIGAKAVHVPYKGGAPALADLAAGRVDFMFAVAPEALPLIKAGEIKALAVTTKERIRSLPDLPTVAETGVPGFEMLTWYGAVVPAGTPDVIVDKLNAAFNVALQDEHIASRLRDLGFEISGGSPKQLEDQMASDADKWGTLIKKMNITLD
ncbi:ABC transporter substrate-binding protein [Bordetella genomosp. 10]|uniref:ABC transporter substrate-binding protein n=1 Tax=Bordetella genomosp. 10 TaxID=1416804 RepID=A0A261SKE0_9BORD|nr:tripartite tricarboxylate transporter substrate binding protein [Bordetella genomosp. 10]OZI37874.1 ABC transporter substrate-binding protein [Bordetella genomosp. 10]